MCHICTRKIKRFLIEKSSLNSERRAHENSFSLQVNKLLFFHIGACSVLYLEIKEKHLHVICATISIIFHMCMVGWVVNEEKNLVSSISLIHF